MRLPRPPGDAFDSRSLRSNALLVGSITAVASVIALARDVIVSRSVGFGGELDTWSVALAWTTVGTSALVSGISAAVVPWFSGRRLSQHGSPAIGSAMDVVATTGLAGGVLGIVLWLSSDQIAGLLAPPTSEQSLETVLRVMSVIVIAPAAMRGAAASLLHAGHRFALPAASTMLTSGCVMAVALTGTVDAERLALAHGVGLTAEALLLTGVLARREGVTASVAGCRALARALARPVATTSAGSLLFGVGPVIDLWFAGRVDEGKAGQLAVAGRIPLAIAAMLTTAFATPAFPTIAQRATSGARGALDGTWAAMRSTLWPVVGATTAIVLFSIPTASLAFRGSEVTAEQARAVAVVQMIYALTIPTYVAGTLFARGLQASGRFGTVFWVGLIGALANVLLDWILSELFGLRGIAFATAVVYAFVLALMWLELGRLARRSGVMRPTGGGRSTSA